jgi:hypothetical protein
MSDARIAITQTVDASAATTALEFIRAQLPPLPDEADAPEERPVGSEENTP